jgi:peptidoglycan/xylan/chitin deacetylase (PgdA/CDA1 family)
MKLPGAGRKLLEVVAAALVIVPTTRHTSQALPPRSSIVRSVATKERIVALTYDDGPHPVFTPEILGILDRYGVKATFFMIGSEMEQYPDIVKEVIARGHAIGNHTYTHPQAAPPKRLRLRRLGNIEVDTAAQVFREIEECERVIERMTGMRTHIFRPPLGLVDRTVSRIVDEQGYRTILWTVSADHHDAPTPQLMAQRVLKRIRPGAIILAHDGSLGIRWKDVAATPIIIQSLLKRGYRFVTVPELLRRGAQAKVVSSPHGGSAM